MKLPGEKQAFRFESSYLTRSFLLNNTAPAFRVYQALHL